MVNLSFKISPFGKMPICLYKCSIIKEACKLKIEKLSQSTIKVHLSKAELEQYNIALDDICTNNDFSKQFLSEIIAVATASTQFEPQSDNYTVEVFAQSSGCILYISSYGTKRYKQKQCESIMCRFENNYDLFTLCSSLKMHADKISQSMIYADNVDLYLTIRPENAAKEAIKHIVREFGKTLITNAYEQSRILEESRVIIDSDAIGKINAMIKT